MPDWRASFWVNHCAEQNSSQMPGVCTPHPAGGGEGGGVAVLELNGTQ